MRLSSTTILAVLLATAATVTAAPSNERRQWGNVGVGGLCDVNTDCIGSLSCRAIGGPARCARNNGRGAPCALPDVCVLALDEIRLDGVR
jgi:hypothetical protein